MHASAAGQEKTVKLLLENKANPNETDNMKWTSLHHAVNSGGLGVTKLLIEGFLSLNYIFSYFYDLSWR